MTKNTRLVSMGLLAVLAVAGCSREIEPAGATPSNSEAAVAAPSAVATPSVVVAPSAVAASSAVASPVAEPGVDLPAATTALWADPLPTCSGTQVTTVYWSKEAVAAGPARIEVGEGASAGLFASIGSEGKKDTGEWAGPGLVLTLRGADDGVERARIALAGPANCK